MKFPFKKYISVDKFISLSKTYSNSELCSYIVLNFLSARFKTSEIDKKKFIKYMSFIYSTKAASKALRYLKMGNLITNNSDTIIINKKFKDLTTEKNNVMQLREEDLQKYKKNFILFIKYQIFAKIAGHEEKKCILKYANIEKVLNISRYEIYQMKKLIDEDLLILQNTEYSGKQLKYELGKEDTNFRLMKNQQVQTPNSFWFYPPEYGKKDLILIKFKLSYKYIFEKKMSLVKGYNFQDHDSQSGNSGNNSDNRNYYSLIKNFFSYANQKAEVYMSMLINNKKYNYKKENIVNNILLKYISNFNNLFWVTDVPEEFRECYHHS